MKVLTKEQSDIYYRAIQRGGTLGGVLGLGVGVVVTTALNRCLPGYRTLTPSIRALVAIYPSFVLASYGADRGSQSFGKP